MRTHAWPCSGVVATIHRYHPKCSMCVGTMHNISHSEAMVRGHQDAIDIAKLHGSHSEAPSMRAISTRPPIESRLGHSCTGGADSLLLRVDKLPRRGACG
jgi:hypothetical protein